MKAVVLTNFGDTSGLVLKEVPIPEPKSNDVRVKIIVASFNPVDYKIRKGWFGGTTPTILGCDFSGVVDAVGSDVKNYTKGDEVFGIAIGPLSSNGSYAQYLVVSQFFISKKPTGISHAAAAGLAIAGSTAVEVIRKCNLRENSSVLVIGASGGVGSAVVQLLRLHKVKIFATAGSPASVEYLLKSIPSEHVIPYSGLSNDELRQKILVANGGRGVDTVIDLVGGESKKLGFSVLGYDGTIVSIVEEQEASYQTPLYPCQGPHNLFGVNGTLTMCFFVAFLGPDTHPVMAKILSEVSKEVEKGMLKPLETKIMGDLSVETVVKAHAELETHHTKGKMVMNVSS